MRPHIRTVIGSVIGITVLMIFTDGFHLGGAGVLTVGRYAPLLGAFIGGGLTLFSVSTFAGKNEFAEPWRGHERLAWILIGCGCIAWAIGECFWRYYSSIGQSPFPSLADFGYSTLPPLIFLGLILQPFSGMGIRRTLVVLDSLISMGSLFAIAWFLLLGSLAQDPGEANFAKFLGLYYPTSDIALLSCVVFLLLREQGRVFQATASRISLLILGAGLCVYAIADFNFNVQQNLGTFVDGTWPDLGWPLGMMTVGVAAYLRQFLPASIVRGTSSEDGEKKPSRQLRFGLPQAVPYLLLTLLFLVLVINVFSADKTQQGIRPVLIVVTIIVVSLVAVRQVVTILENEHLIHEQTKIHEQLEQIYEEIAQRQATLEAGVANLKAVQTRLANGDVRARAALVGGELWPLANGINIMADRMMRSEQRQRYAQKIIQALSDLCQALEQRGGKSHFVLPASCLDAPPELHQFLLVLGLMPSLPKPPAHTPHIDPLSNTAGPNLS
jgi:hypothetical protein